MHILWYLVLILTSMLSGCGIFLDGYGNGCFIAGTKMSTPDGDTSIETLQVGNRVYAWDETQNAVIESVVDELVVHQDLAPWMVTLDSGEKLHVTPDHPLFVTALKRWQPVSELTIGTELKVLGHDLVLAKAKITAIEKASSPEVTYNLKVRHYENSFANGVLAHFY